MLPTFYSNLILKHGEIKISHFDSGNQIKLKKKQKKIRETYDYVVKLKRDKDVCLIQRHH